MIHLLKVFAAQLIVWHHLALYGPLADTLRPQWGGLFDWLEAYGKLAVPIFLVVAGYLAAPAWGAQSVPSPLRLIWRRYRRLAEPYSLALLLAIATAALARTLINHPDTPAAPTFQQLLAHIFLLQDILNYPALSTGVWYIAIDLQLYALLVLLFWLGREHALHAVAFLMVASLLWLNQLAELELWGVYFFGAYAAGFMARRILLDADPARSRKHGLWLIALFALALILDWRSRIFIAGLTVMLLMVSVRSQWQPEWANSALIQWLSRTSYALFLVHYPVSVLIGALTEHSAPGSEDAAILGMLATWLLSLGAAHLLHTRIEARQVGAGRTAPVSAYLNPGKQN